MTDYYLYPIFARHNTSLLCCPPAVESDSICYCYSLHLSAAKGNYHCEVNIFELEQLVHFWQSVAPNNVNAWNILSVKCLKQTSTNFFAECIHSAFCSTPPLPSFPPFFWRLPGQPCVGAQGWDAWVASQGTGSIKGGGHWHPRPKHSSSKHWDAIVEENLI